MDKKIEEIREDGRISFLHHVSEYNKKNLEEENTKLRELIKKQNELFKEQNKLSAEINKTINNIDCFTNTIEKIASGEVK